MKLNKEGYDSLKDELAKNASLGPFSKTTDIMLAFDLMEKEDINSNQVTKANLYNIIKVLCAHLNWDEEEFKEPMTKDEISDNSKSENQDNKSSLSSAQPVEKDSHDVCKFYKNIKCRYGKSGRNIDANGKVCAYRHPQICKKFQDFGDTQNGCKEKKCENLHLNICKIFKKHGNCKFANKCKFFHPRKWKNVSQSNGKSLTQIGKNIHPCSMFQNTYEQNPTYAYIARKNLQPKVQFNKQQEPIRQAPIAQSQFMKNQQPFLEQKKSTQRPFLEEDQNNQKQILDLLVSMNQKMISQENNIIQMQMQLNNQ